MNLSERYDSLVNRIDNLMKKHNPCQWDFETSNCSRGTNGCCNGCPNLSATGCTIVSLACKLWVCPSVSAQMPKEALKEFMEVWDDAMKYNLVTFRASKEVSVKNAKYCTRTKEVNCVCVNKYGESSWILG